VDKLSFTGASNIGSTNVVPVASSGKAAINPNSVATFDTSDTTLAQQVNAVANSLATSGVGVSAVWGNGLDTYVFIKGAAGTATTPAATDVLVKLTNITFNATADTLSTFMSGVTAVVVTSTEGNDYLIGTASNDGINGQGGNDTVLGLGGDDTLSGGPGNDDLDAGVGSAAANNKLTGDAGNDIFRITAAATGTEKVTITDLGGAAGGEADVLIVSSGVIAGSVITIPVTAGWIAGAATTIGSDVTLTPTSDGTTVNLSNVTAPGTGKWTISTKSAVVTGSSVADTITGSAGADTFTGGKGGDELTGGAKADTFIFEAVAADNGNDLLKDFKIGATTTGSAAGDVLNFKNFLSGGTVANAKTTGNVYTPPTTSALAASGVSIAIGGKALIINGNTASVTGFDTTAEVATLLTDTKAWDAVDVAASTKAVIIAGAGGTATTSYIYAITNDATAAVTEAEITLIGTITNTAGDIAKFATANIVFA